jgi:hypothetical protein
MVKQSTHNRLSVGSIPTRRTNLNSMNEIVNFLINFAVVYFLVRIVFRLIARRLEKQIVHVEHAVQSEYVILDLEHIDNQYFCYDTQTKDFVCQGQDLEEIRKRFRERFPGKSAAIYNGDELAVKILKD